MGKVPLLSVGEAAEMLGVSVVTIRRWCSIGKLKVFYRTVGNHRRFSLPDIKAILGVKDNRKVYGYARVSSHDQKADLVRQADYLHQEGAQCVLSDVGSGLNCKKPGLKKLLLAIISGEMSTLVLSHTDRLLRFGHELVFNLCKWFKVEVKVLRRAIDKAFEVELAEDVITLMTVFSARLYGKRSHQSTQKALE